MPESSPVSNIIPYVLIGGFMGLLLYKICQANQAHEIPSLNLEPSELIRTNKDVERTHTRIVMES